MSRASVSIWLRALASVGLAVWIWRSLSRSIMLFIMWWGRWQWIIQSPGYLASNSTTLACATPTRTVLVGYQVDSGARPPSVPVMTNWLPWRWMGWWSMPRLTKRRRTRLPRRAMSGVVEGAERPLKVSQLNSMEAVLGTVLDGRMAHSWRTMA